MQLYLPLCPYHPVKLGVKSWAFAIALASLALGFALGFLAAGLQPSYSFEPQVSTVKPASESATYAPLATSARTPGQAVSSGAEPTYSLPEGRKVVVEGYARLRVGEGEVKTVADQLSAIAERLGGYIGEMSVWESGGFVILKVPYDRYSEALEEVKRLGEAVEVRTVASDVTEQYVDLSARLNASKALERRLLEILAQAKNVDEMLKVEEYLARVRADIERYEAQLKNLERRVQFSTIYVQIEAPQKEVKPLVQFPTFDIVPALARALGLLYSVIYALVTVVIGFSPLAALGAAGYLVYRKLRANTQQKQQSG